MGLTFVCVTLLLLVVGSQATKRLSITADDKIDELYVNGVLTPVPSGSWPTVRVINIPDNTRLIAVKAEDVFRVVSGILASVEGPQLVTDQTWKCTTSYFTNWMSPTFDDSSWPNAAIAGPNSASDIHGYQPLIDSTAKWIWTRNYADPNIDSIVYCRGHLVPYQKYTCDVGSNPCTPGTQRFYFSHTTPDHFVQCSEWGQCYVMPCAPGTAWNQDLLTCAWAGTYIDDPCRTDPPPTHWTCEPGRNPCTPENAAAGHFYFQYITQDYFVQCDAFSHCWVMPCAPGTHWRQDLLTCDHN